MENPASWDELTKCIDEAIREHEELVKNHEAWLSLPTHVKNRILERFSVVPRSQG